MTLTLLDSMTIDHPGADTRTLSLYQGDITALDAGNAVDFLCISALPGDYSPTPGSVIGALAAKGVSVQAQSANRAANYEPVMPCWVSQDVSSAGLNFKRLIVFEPANPATAAGWDIGLIFRAMKCFQGSAASSIALPMVSTGSGGADLAVILRQLFFVGTQWAGLNGWPVSEIRLVAYSQAHADAAKTQFAAMKPQYANPPYATGGGTAPSGTTQRQYNCVRAYTGNAYHNINTALRANSLIDPQYIQYIATITGISAGLANLPDWSGLSLRGADLPQSVIDQYKVGATITHISFTSSSWSRAFPSKCLLKITSVSGKDVSKISHFPSEDEILYDYRMTDDVTAIAGAGGGYQFQFTSTQTIPNYCNS